MECSVLTLNQGTLKLKDVEVHISHDGEAVIVEGEDLEVSIESPTDACITSGGSMTQVKILGCKVIDIEECGLKPQTLT